MEQQREGPPEDAKRTKKYFRVALTFGVVMATIEMVVLLYIMYC